MSRVLQVLLVLRVLLVSRALIYEAFVRCPFHPILCHALAKRIIAFLHPPEVLTSSSYPSPSLFSQLWDLWPTEWYSNQQSAQTINLEIGFLWSPHPLCVKRGGVEKCCNLQNPMNTSRQLGQVKICSTLRDLICHILWPFYCYFMAFFGSKWPHWAIGSPSDPKWVEHWLNMVEHCTSHLGGWVWTLFAPKKWHLGAPEPPKNDPFWP